MPGNVGANGSSFDDASSGDIDLEALRREYERLRTERDSLRNTLDQIAQVIGARDSDRILHDVRNVMNELVLLRNLADLDE
jgi:hypothetical protein